MSDIGSTTQYARAGFWRRFAAALIDALVVTVPIQLVVVVLFAMTNGAIQTTSGIAFNNCTHTVPVTQLPPGLDPPPPEGANRAVICSTSFFGLETARRLIVSRTTKEGIVTKTYARTYMLGADGQQKNGTSLDWLALLTLAIYLIALEHRFGATVGKRVLGLRVAEALDLQRVGIPLQRAVIRNVMIWLGVLPMLIVLLVGLLLGHGDLEALWAGGFVPWFAASGLLGMAWYLWMAILVARKRDPIYDRIAGTAVLRG